MRYLLILLVPLVLVAGPVAAQCCLGAQDAAGESAGGRYRVEATSLTGTGFSNHGPYRFRFQWSRREPDGTYRAGPAFEVAFDSTNHFGMDLLVSPTGNGFLLDTRIAPVVVFYSPDGRALASLDGRRYQVGWSERLSPDGFRVSLRSAVARPVEGGSQYDPAGVLFLPFAAPIEGELKRQILLAFALGSEERAARADEAARLVVELDADDFGRRSAATEALAALGPLAQPALEAALAGDSSPEVAGRARRLLDQLAPWRAAGGLAALEDPLLLVGLAADPDEEVAAAARRRLDGIVPEGVGPDGWRAWAESVRR